MFLMVVLATLPIANVLANDFCSKYGSPEVLDDLLTRTRNQLPSTFMLPTRVGLIGIYSANITNLNTFHRSPERQITCSGNTIRLPVIWFKKPTGRFMATGKHLKFVRKVYMVTIGILEASLLIEFKPTDDLMSIATLKTLSVTRLSNIEVRAIGFGFIGKIISTVTTLIIRFFETVFHAFLEDNLKNEIENVMVEIPVVKYFPTFFWNVINSGKDDEEENVEESEPFFPGKKRGEGVEADENPKKKEEEVIVEDSEPFFPGFKGDGNEETGEAPKEEEGGQDSEALFPGINGDGNEETDETPKEEEEDDDQDSEPFFPGIKGDGNEETDETPKKEEEDFDQDSEPFFPEINGDENEESGETSNKAEEEGVKGEDSQPSFPGLKEDEGEEDGGRPKVVRNSFPELEEDDFEVFMIRTEKPALVNKKVDDDDLSASGRENGLGNEEMEWLVPGEDEVEVFGSMREVEKEHDTKNREGKSGRPSKGGGELEVETPDVSVAEEVDTEFDDDHSFEFEKIDPRIKNRWLGYKT